MRDLADKTSDVKTVAAAGQIIGDTLSEHGLEVPFALLYLLDAEGKEVRLAGRTGLELGSAASPQTVALDGPENSGWPLAQAARERQVVEVEGLSQRFGSFACGPYPEVPQRALVLPIMISGVAHPFGLLVAGVSARRALDDAY